MGKYQEVFKRYEKKYIINGEIYIKLLQKLEEYFVPDKFAESKICNIYFDTPEHLLIRNSIEKPVYKEKLRIRSYGIPDENSKVFMELKKKYKGIVYKRRVVMTLAQSKAFIEEGISPGINPQIENELRYFLDFYKGIAPAMFLSYKRISLCGKENPALRITFDSDITYRDYDILLEKGIYGEKLIDENTRIMELKIPEAMPLWLSSILDELKIYPASYSKYGNAYLNTLKKDLTNNNKGTVIISA